MTVLKNLDSSLMQQNNPNKTQYNMGKKKANKVLSSYLEQKEDLERK